MPITSNKEIIPFVNGLEERVNEINEMVRDWTTNKQKILSGLAVGQQASSSAALALSKVDEALGEITNAAFGVTAGRGFRLKAKLDELQSEILTLVENGAGSGSGGGGGALTEGEFYEELNNAISRVDSSVHEGLKLDYLISSIRDQVEDALLLKKKLFTLPIKEKFIYESGRTYTAKEREDIVKIHPGEVIILNEKYQVVTNQYDGELNVSINDKRMITFSQEPLLEEGDIFYIYYQADQEFSKMPQDAVAIILDTVVKKGESVATDLEAIEEALVTVHEDIEAMKGTYWTPDFSIMKNHIDLTKEIITPKGLYLREKDDKTFLSFSYVDHPALSHFEAEEYDEENNAWVPVNNGNNGIISK